MEYKLMMKNFPLDEIYMMGDWNAHTGTELDSNGIGQVHTTGKEMITFVNRNHLYTHKAPNAKHIVTRTPICDQNGQDACIDYIVSRNAPMVARHTVHPVDEYRVNSDHLMLVMCTDAKVDYRTAASGPVTTKIKKRELVLDEKKRLKYQQEFRE